MKEFFSIKNLWVSVFGLYTVLNLALMWSLFFDPNLIFDIWDRQSTILSGVFIFLFLNAALGVYYQKNQNVTIGILAVYTFLNLKLLYPVLSTFDACFGCVVTATGRLVDSAPLFLGLFLNAALILYWLKSRHE